MGEDERTKALQDLIELRCSVDDAVKNLERFTWDHDTAIVVVRPSDGRRVLDAYLQGTLAAGAVERWAEAIECRDDVSFEPGAEDQLTALVFELANPTLTRSLDADAATEWIAGLS